MKLNLLFPRNTISSIKTLHNIGEVAEEFERIYEDSKNDGQRLLIHELNLVFHESLGMEEFDSVIYFLDATINFWNDHTKIKMSVEKLVITFKGFEFLIKDLVNLFSICNDIEINGGLFSGRCLEKYLFFLKNREVYSLIFSLICGGEYEKNFMVSIMTTPNNERIVIFVNVESNEVYYENDFFEEFGYFFI